MRELLSKVAFFVAVLWAALRLARLDRRHDLRELADRLRAVNPWRASYLTNPRYLDGSVSRVLELLPPRRFGPCLKGSLLLLDLWSRCGLDPRIHIGTLKHEGERQLHAWVSLPGSDTPAEPSGYAEIWSS